MQIKYLRGMTNHLQIISDALVAAHASQVAIDQPEQRFGALTVEDAYAIQETVAAARGRVAGWKTGAASVEEEPIKAPIMEADILDSGATAKAPGDRQVGIELEIAFRIARDFPPRGAPYERKEIEAGIDAVLPAIELVDSRLTPIGELDPMWKLADAQVNLGLVIGEARVDRLNFDAGNGDVRLTFDGDVVVQGLRSNSAGDPLRLIEWMINTKPEHCGGLRRGQIITTGSLTGIQFVPPGTRVEGDILGLGNVAVTIIS